MLTTRHSKAAKKSNLRWIPGQARDDKNGIINHKFWRKHDVISDRKAELFMLLKRGTFHFALTVSHFRLDFTEGKA